MVHRVFRLSVSGTGYSADAPTKWTAAVYKPFPILQDNFSKIILRLVGHAILGSDWLRNVRFKASRSLQDAFGLKKRLYLRTLPSKASYAILERCRFLLTYPPNAVEYSNFSTRKGKVMSLRIALDYDDTWTADKELWAYFVTECVEKGHTVYCVTARWDTEENRREIRDDFARFKLDWAIRGPYFSNLNSKKERMDKLGIEIDIWIDDNPDAIINGIN